MKEVVLNKGHRHHIAETNRTDGTATDRLRFNASPPEDQQIFIACRH
jgi:hypothetical protein